VSDTRPQRLVLRRGVVASVDREGPATEITVDVDGEPRRATSYPELTGPVTEGDEVVVNTAAVDLGLGSGGFDVVHANLTRGLAGEGEPGAHVMKLNYTSLQHAVQPLEERAPEVALALDRPVAVCFLHAQLPCVAWAAHERAPEARLGYVQGAGGALPGALSRTVADLTERGLLAGHVTAGAAFGGEHDAITVAGALNAGLTELGWDGAIVAPGPGIVGSATALGHGGLAALDAAHAALALGCETLIVPRMSSGDPRERHRGLSHHSKTVLELLLRPALVALPQRAAVGLPGDHEARPGRADIQGYAASGLPATTMGRSIEEDQLFFGAALAGGSVLGELLA
jgi:Protein of unknown function (DUF3866)